MSLYFWVLLLSGIVPLIFSFERKIKFYTKWKYLLPSLIIVAIPYLIWDHIFTVNGYWGFNENYLQGIYLFSLPIEEVLFFIVIPYCCVFTYYSLKFYFPKVLLPQKITHIISLSIFILCALVLMFNATKTYTLVNGLYLFVILSFTYYLNKNILNRFYWIYIVIIVPFVIVNGILTGSLIENEIVWYNIDAIIGIRLITIPIEDFFYAFSLILANIVVVEELELRTKVGF